MDTANLWVDKSKYYSDLAMEYLGINMDKAMVFTDSSLHYSNMALDYLENYPKIFEGWTMDHTYQATVNGQEKEMSSVFYLDTLYKVFGSMPKDLETE